MFPLQHQEFSHLAFFLSKINAHTWKKKKLKAQKGIQSKPLSLLDHPLTSNSQSKGKQALLLKNVLPAVSHVYSISSFSPYQVSEIRESTSLFFMAFITP